MLASSIAVTALSDPAAAGQASVAPESADGFQALLNASGNADAFNGNSNSAALSNGNSDSPPANNNNPQPQQNPPSSSFAAGHAQSLPTPPSPPQTQKTAPAPSAGNNGNTGTQNTHTPSAPVLKSSATSSPSHGQQQASQNTSTSSGQAAGNITPAANQLRAQIKSQLNDISEILLSMIQALSAAPVMQPVQSAQQPAASTDTSGTLALLPLVAAGNNAADPATGGQQSAGATPTDQEIALLKDMQSLLGQLQQSLDGTGQSQDSQSGQDNVQTISDALLADVAKLSQLLNPLPASGSGDAPAVLTDSLTQFTGISDLLKGAIAQTRSQLQALQASNDVIFAQASTTDFQVPPNNAASGLAKPAADANANNVLTNTLPVITADPSSAPAAPVAAKTDAGNSALLFTQPAAATISQGDGNAPGNNGNQNSGQNQPSAQPLAAAAPSSSSPPSPSGGASFAKVLTQVSQNDVLNQVQFQVKTALADGSSKITIQLNPPELGKLDIKLDVSADGKASGVTITATNQNTLNLLQRDTQGLMRALHDAGLASDSGSLNFSLNQGGQQQAQAGSQQAATTYSQAQPVEEEPDINVITRNYVVNLAQGLDITI